MTAAGFLLLFDLEQKVSTLKNSSYHMRNIDYY